MDIFIGILAYLGSCVIAAVLLFTGKFPGKLYGMDWNDAPELTGLSVIGWPITLIISLLSLLGGRDSSE